jgi:hypothetical protein
MKRTFAPRKAEKIGGWRKLHNEELQNLYSSPSIIRMIKSRMRQIEHAACVSEKRNQYKVLVENVDH